MTVSKTNYKYARACPEKLWLHEHRKDLFPETEDSRHILKTGLIVGELARGLFGEYVNVEVRNGDRPDIGKMIASTEAEMAKGEAVICEAAFSANGRYCAVDILRKHKDGWAIYEVKASSSNKPESEIKEEYFPDVAFQKRVLEDCGVRVTGTFLVRLNSDYVRGEELDIKELFDVREITPEELKDEEALVDEYTRTAAEMLKREARDPAVELNEKCKDCECWKFCSRNLPSPSVFDLYNMNFKDKIKHYRNGVISFEDIAARNLPLSKVQKRQVEFRLEKKEPLCDTEKLRGFLNGLHYPLCFLDFETVQPRIPAFPGISPFKQYPFLYSLHVVDKKGADTVRKHGCFVEPEQDPRRKIAESLCEEIPEGACVVAYMSSVEGNVLKNLAGIFPDLSDRLMGMAEGIRDLLVPFAKGWYYNRAMNNFSLKTVLPALFPDNPDLDYSNLEGVHGGMQAMNVYLDMPDMSPEEREKTKRELIEYCNLDTFSLAGIWRKLAEFSGVDV